MALNTTLLQDNALLGAAQFVNQASDGWFGILLLIALYAVFWAILKVSSDNATAFSVTSWICAFLALLLWTTGLIVNYVMYISFTLAAIGFAWQIARGS